MTPRRRAAARASPAQHQLVQPQGDDHGYHRDQDRGQAHVEVGRARLEPEHGDPAGRGRGRGHLGHHSRQPPPAPPGRRPPRRALLPSGRRPGNDGGAGERGQARPPGRRAGRGGPREQRGRARPGEDRRGHGGGRGAACPEPEQLPQRRAPNPAQGQLGQPADRQHPGRQQQRHQPGDRQAGVHDQQQHVHLAGGRDEGGQRLGQPVGHGEGVRQRRQHPGQPRRLARDPVHLLVEGGGAPRPGRRAGWQLPLQVQAPLAEQLLHHGDLARARDHRRLPGRRPAGAVEGGLRQQRVGRPERRAGVGWRDDPGDVQLDLHQLARLIGVDRAAQRQPRARPQPEPARRLRGDRDLEAVHELGTGGHRGRPGARQVAGHQPQVARQR